MACFPPLNRTMSNPFVITGRCSFFGGPGDKGVAPSEDLALYETEDVALAPAGMFLSTQPPGTTGTARRLNNGFPYIAMRWAYADNQRNTLLYDRHGRSLGVCLPVTTPRVWLKVHRVFVSNPKHPELPPVPAWGVDWGPNSDTNRIADLAPFFGSKLSLNTNDMVTISIPL